MRAIVRRVAWMVIATVVLTGALTAQEIAGILPTDIFGLIRLGPIDSAQKDFEDLATFLSLPALKAALATDLGQVFLNKDMSGIDRKRAVGLVMLNPQEFSYPYVVMAPVSSFENFVKG